MKWSKLIFILFLGLIFRLILTPLAVNGDTITQAAWGDWIYQHGFLGFYDVNIWAVEWPNHPPLISLWYGAAYSLHSFLMGILTNLGSFIAFHHLGATKILWYYQAVTWFDQQTYSTLTTLYGIIITLKLLPIIADLDLALVVYLLTKATNPRRALLFTGLYLFLPFSWYLSALWGQTDQLATLFLALSFWLLFKRQFILSPILLAIAFDLKPTILLFIPIYLVWLFLKKVSWQFGIGLILGLTIIYYSVALFTLKDPLFYAYDHLLGVLFFTKTPATSISAFNFWFIFHGNDRLSDLNTFLFPYRIWGLLGYILVNILALKAALKKDLHSLIFSLFIVGFGSWLFFTNMYERYAFAGVFFGLLLCVFHPKLLKLWIPLSFIFLLDMYHGWWYPDWLPFFQGFLYLGNWFFSRILSLINIGLFFTICFLSLDSGNQKRLLLKIRHFSGKIHSTRV